MHLIMSSAKWRPFCLRLNVLMEEAKMYLYLISFLHAENDAGIILGMGSPN